MMERSVIKGAKSIAQYKILQWVNENFVDGYVYVLFDGNDRGYVYDELGASIAVEYHGKDGIVEIDI